MAKTRFVYSLGVPMKIKKDNFNTITSIKII